MKKLICGLSVLFAMVAFVAVGDDAKKSDEVELKGKLGCGHCEYHKTASCAAVVKTADGKFYVVDNATKEVMDARIKGSDIKVAGQVTEKDTLLHVQASKQELLK